MTLTKTKKRLRSLVVRNDASALISKPNKCCSIFKTLCIGIVLSTALLLANDEHFLNDLKRLSLTQYQIYVYGTSDYCKTDFDVNKITETLRETVYGQDEAMESLYTALRAHKNITSLIIIGSQGVGKSLTLNTIQNKFPWQYNMQHTTWTNVGSQQTHLHRLMKMIPKLTPCGQNGIFVDNIRIEDVSIIAEFNEKFLEYCKESAIKVMAFYVFNDGLLNASKTISADRKQISAAAVSIPHTKSILFRNFNATDLLNCIHREAERLGIFLSAEDIQAIASNVDVDNTGCKTVVAKVSRHHSMTD